MEWKFKARMEWNGTKSMRTKMYKQSKKKLNHKNWVWNVPEQNVNYKVNINKKNNKLFLWSTLRME